MHKGNKLYQKAKKLIPGGTQLLSKRPEMFLPELWPAYYSKAKGCEVYDLDNNKFIDTSLMGVGACTLGYADDDIDNAVKQAIDNGSMSTLNVPQEVELAEKLVELHPWADMVRFARTGGESVSIAVRIARAYTKKELVLFCGYHGWSDWYLAANISNNEALNAHHIAGLEPLGVPQSLGNTAIPFYYNDVESLRSLVKKHKGKIAAIVTEPLRNMNPTKEFINELHKVKAEENIPLILDEVSYGWRLALGGAHLKLGIEPDIAVFAKGMSNGYPMGAIIGRKEVMQAAQISFISSTYWTEAIGPVAALATINKMQKVNLVEHLDNIGGQVMAGWNKIAEKYSLKIHLSGFNPVAHFGFDYENRLELKTLFTQIMLERGFLATTAFYVSYAHKQKHVDEYLESVDYAFEKIKHAIDTNSVSDMMKTEVSHSGFKRLN